MALHVTRNLVVPNLWTSGVTRAIDTDFGASGVQTQAWFNALPGMGIEGFITTLHTYWGGDSQPWAPAQIALTRALSAGLWIGAYGRPVETWSAALDVLDAPTLAALKFYALDVETEDVGNHPLTQTYVDGVTGRGVRPIVYTTGVQWPAIMGSNKTQFGSLDLWEYAGTYEDGTTWPATMKGVPSYTFDNGWNVSKFRTGWQLNAESPQTISGITVNFNVFDRAYILG